VRTARDWGVSTTPLLLTNRRLICPADAVGHAVAVIPLNDIREVRLRKPFIGYRTVVIERKTQPPASFPAHINGERIRADIEAAVLKASPTPHPDAPQQGGREIRAPDRYDRLRQIGELRSSGVLTEAEFEEEKARILKGP
jgi:hypothetical protein